MTLKHLRFVLAPASLIAGLLIAGESLAQDRAALQRVLTTPYGSDCNFLSGGGCDGDLDGYLLIGRVDSVDGPYRPGIYDFDPSSNDLPLWRGFTPNPNRRHLKLRGAWTGGLDPNGRHLKLRGAWTGGLDRAKQAADTANIEADTNSVIDQVCSVVPIC